MFTYTITIGRGTGDRRLDDADWATFEDEVNELLSNYVYGDDDMVEVHRGTGSWGGVEEESSKATLLVENPLNVNEGYITHNLRRLARTYNQDAIALTIGQSELITK